MEIGFGGNGGFDGDLDRALPALEGPNELTDITVVGCASHLGCTDTLIARAGARSDLCLGSWEPLGTSLSHAARISLGFSVAQLTDIPTVRIQGPAIMIWVRGV